MRTKNCVSFARHTGKNNETQTKVALLSAIREYENPNNDYEN